MGRSQSPASPGWTSWRVKCNRTPASNRLAASLLRRLLPRLTRPHPPSPRSLFQLAPANRDITRLCVARRLPHYVNDMTRIELVVSLTEKEEGVCRLSFTNRCAARDAQREARGSSASFLRRAMRCSCAHSASTRGARRDAPTPCPRSAIGNRFARLARRRHRRRRGGGCWEEEAWRRSASTLPTRWGS